MKIKDLKSPYRELATEYAYDNGWSDEDIRIGLELSDAFDWQGTPEEYDFWDDVDSFIYRDTPQSSETPQQNNNTLTDVLKEIEGLIYEHIDIKYWGDDGPSIEGKDTLLIAIGELLKKHI